MSGMDQRYTIEAAFANYLAIDSKQKTEASQKSDTRFLAIAEYYFKGHKLALLDQVGLESLEIFERWLGQPQKCGSIAKPAWLQQSIARHCKVLKVIFKKAYHSGKIPRNPAEIWRISRGNPGKRRPMTWEEFEKILVLAPHWYKPILHALAFTGARPVAIADLCWSDVDFARATLKLKSRKGGKNKMKTILIPMIPELSRMLSELWNQRAGGPVSANIPTQRVFINDRQEIVTASMISKTGSRLIKKAGLNGVVLYCIRHALATDLLSAGVDSDIARRILGHSDPRMLDEYTSHLGTEQLQKALTLVRGKTEK